MIVEGKYAITITTHSDWLKHLAPVCLNQSEAKQKAIAPCARDFSRALTATGNC